MRKHTKSKEELARETVHGNDQMLDLAKMSMHLRRKIKLFGIKTSDSR